MNMFKEKNIISILPSGQLEQGLNLNTSEKSRINFEYSNGEQRNDLSGRENIKKELERVRREISGRTEASIGARKQELHEQLKAESRKALETGDYTGMRRIKNELAFINDTAPEKKPIELKTLLIMKHIFGKKVGRREVEDFLLNNSHADPIELLNCGIDQLAEKCDAVIRTANQS